MPHYVIEYGPGVPYLEFDIRVCLVHEAGHVCHPLYAVDEHGDHAHVRSVEIIVVLLIIMLSTQVLSVWPTLCRLMCIFVNSRYEAMQSKNLL